MAFRAGLAILISILALAPAAAEEDTRAPEKLVVGYDEEGNIDASDDACRAFVVEMVEWSVAETEQGIRDVCKARKRHVDAYERLQRDYAVFVKAFNEDTRLDIAAAVKGFAAMTKGCIDFRDNLTTGGHNIALDIIPNTIAADCLENSAGLMEAATKAYTDK